MLKKSTYKKTEIGEIPEDWELVALGNISDSVSETYKFDDEQVVFLNTSDIFEGKVLHSDKSDPKILPGQAKKRIQKDDILFSEIRPANKRYAFIDFDAPKHVVSTKLMVLQARPKILPKYLYTFLICPKTLTDFQILAESRSGTFPQITFQEISGYPVALPPLSEQQQIVDFFYSVNDKIELNRKMNKTLEEVVKAIFKRWFLDFEFLDDDNKPYKSSGGKMVDSELGDIPKGWKIVALGDVLSAIESGQRPKGGVGKYNKGIPSIGAENINGLANYDYSKEKYIPQDFYNKMTRGILKHKDVLLYKDGAYIGKKTIYRNEFPHAVCCINEHVFILRTKDKLQNYLYFWLDQSGMTQEIINLNSNAAQPGINQEAIKSLKILVPDDDALNTFDIFIEGVLSKIYENVKENHFISQIRDSLLPRLMSGKLRVKS